MTPFDKAIEGAEFDAKLLRDDFVGCNGKLNLNGQSHWSIRIVRNGYSFETEYHQGSAHRVYCRYYTTSNYFGKPTKNKVKFNWNGRYSHDEYEELRHSVPTEPDFTDVLYCLTMDAQTVEYSDFNDWCAELGYDGDSISAEKMYDACCETRARLNRMFDLDELYTLFQEY